MTNQPYRHAAAESVRSYSFDLRDIVAVIPREMLSGILPASPRLTMQLPPEALDSTRKYLTTSLGMIWRACPVLFAHPVHPGSDRMVVLVKPNEGVVSPFRIASPLRAAGGAGSRPGAGAEAVGRLGAAAGETTGRHPFLQEPVQLGQPVQAAMAMSGPVAPEGGTGESAPSWKRVEEPAPVAFQAEPLRQEAVPAAVEVAAVAGGSPFLAALRDGVAPAGAEPVVREAKSAGSLPGAAPAPSLTLPAPVPAPLPAPVVAPFPEPAGASALASGPGEDVVVFTLGELFGQFGRDALPFDPATVSPHWKVYFPTEFITKQLPSGRVVAGLSQVLGFSELEARVALGGLMGLELEVSIPLRDVFDRLPVPRKRTAGEANAGGGAPAIFAEKGEFAGGSVADREEVFPGRFEPKQTELEPIGMPRGDLADVPEFVSDSLTDARQEEEVASLDELEEGAMPEREGGAVPSGPGVREIGQPGEVDGLPSRHVPDFAGLDFGCAPLADLELRAIFASHEVFTPQLAVERTAALPGVLGVVLFRRNGEIVASHLPGEEGVKKMGRQTPSIFGRIRDLAGELGFAGSEAFTLHTGRGIVSFFGQGQSCLAVLHAERVFEPGMREKLTLIARGMASLLRSGGAD